MQTLVRLFTLGVIILMIWFSAAVVTVVTWNEMMQNAAVILAFLTTLIIGLVAGLDQIGDDSKSQSPSKKAATAEKTKRGGMVADQDARVALLLSMLSEHERESIKSQLLDDLTADGEALSLAELLAAQEVERDRQARG